MGFIRQQEEKLALRYLAWRYQKAKRPLPPFSDLKKRSTEIVNDAHRIARERGGNVMSIVKELIEDIKSRN
ncbi:hypothetical protein ACFLZL_02975 [Thermodesulfobacteriota bacterium]